MGSLRHMRKVEQGEAVNDDLFDEVWTDDLEADFETLLRDGESESCWAILSNLAEALLAKDDGKGKQPRAAIGKVGKRPPDTSRSFARRTHTESRLRKLRGRITQLLRIPQRHGPDGIRLAYIARTVQQMKAQFPKMEDAFEESYDDLGQIIDIKVEEEKQQQTAQGLEDWHNGMLDESKVTLWVKRAEDEGVTEYEVVATVGDTEVLAQQANFWKELWTQKSQLPDHRVIA